jgi:Flp pilus assembly protein TadD
MTGHQVATFSGACTMTSTSKCPASARARKAVACPWRRRLGCLLVACAFGGFACGENPQSSPATSACADADRALASSQWETASSQYTVCLAAGPPRFEVLSNLAMALTGMGRMDEAIQTYRKALVLSSGNPKVRFNLALALIKVGNYEDAVGQLARLKRAGSRDPRVPELLAFCDYHLERYLLASREAEQVYRAHPKEAANALILGSAYTRMGLYQKALPLITFALQSAGSADGHLIMGQTLLGLRLYHPAMDELSQAAAIQPDLPGLHSALGVAKVGLGDSDGGALEFTEALKADPNDFQANYYMGRLERLDGDYEAARKYLTKAEQLHPGAPEVIFEFAAIAMTERDYAKAEPLLGRVLRKQPDHIEAHFLRSDLYRRTGRKQAAQQERDVFERLRQKEQERQSAKTSSFANPPSTRRTPRPRNDD